MTSPLLRWSRLLVGLVLFGAAEGLMVQAAVGVGPWTVLAQGVSRLTGAGVGWLTVVIGLAVLLLWVPLRQRPGPGTVLNVLLVGTVIQATVELVPSPGSLLLRVPLFAAGLVLLAFASGLYLGARLGPGPRDGLMTGLHARTGLRVGWCRAAVELTVLAVGWVLGGDVGAGTVAFALGIGPLVGWFLPRMDPAFRGRPAPQSTGPASRQNSLPSGSASTSQATCP
ncbi:membrane protein YczE [Kineococcus terrestris]|uniref:membrane protein YczE n=1 Tax=Kineococcus terrestris TaxID=2044856 RepID=UPI0034DB176E